MQERRLTIRMPCSCRVQYCTSDDLLPKDSALVNLSERGIGLVARETHLAGERVTVSVSLPEQPEVLTATGEVRWCQARGGRGGRHRIGLAWLPLEETTQDRLTRFLYHAAQSTAARRADRSWRVMCSQALRGRGWVTSFLGIGLLVGGWVLLTLYRHNQDLEGVVHAQRSTLSHLEQRDQLMQRELESARQTLRTTSEDVARLNEQAEALGQRAVRLTQDVARFQASYHQVQQEREALIERVVSLEQARAALVRQAVPLQELQLAIREAVARRQLAGEPAPERSPSANLGNSGYVRHRDPAVPEYQAPTRIRVHTPELPSVPSAQSAKDPSAGWLADPP